MHLAFAITALFPTGGLQRDCLAIAKLLVAAGHRVTIVTSDYREEVDLGGVALELWRPPGLTKAGRLRSLGRQLEAARNRFDRIVGFNKIPGIDVYYCADPPRSELRGRGLASLVEAASGRSRIEGEIFRPAGKTSLIVLADHQVEAYRRTWGTPPTRFRVVPPTLAPARQHWRRTAGDRGMARAELGIEAGVPLWLAVAAAPRTKGTDRTVRALAADPTAVLIIAGVAAGSSAGQWIMGRAARCNVERRVRLLGYREDIPCLMAAADLFVHPARRETTGTAILESVASGLPAVVTGLCGYAPHVAKADAGVVLPDPFREEDLLAALAQARDPKTREAWSRNGLAYGANPALSTGLRVAADLMVGPLWT